MSAHDEAYIAKFQPEPNTYIIHADHTSEMKYFVTDASIRRYCMDKRAWCGWRLVKDPSHWANGFYVCVYPQDMQAREYVRRATPSLGGEE
jgi:hypothetical protein